MIDGVRLSHCHTITTLLGRVHSVASLLLPSLGFRVDASCLMPGQLGRDSLIRVCEELLQVEIDLSVAAGDKAHGSSLLAGAARTADAMGVRFDGVWHVVVDNQCDILHVNATARDICGNEHVVLARLEALQRNLACVLRLAAVQDNARVARMLQRTGDRVAVGAGVDKHDGWFAVHLVQVLLQHGNLLRVRALPGQHLDHLRDIDSGAADGADLHDDGSAQVLARNALHSWRHGR
mmetsp:Transcript_37337/g.95443  ORF Transcript_37337/g.95443 Transcript_37337/m.95443 type:complete len:236 (+) Transcript_37337:61-768(+)